MGPHVLDPVLDALRAEHCPNCGASLEWLRLVDMRYVYVAWRSGHGPNPKSFDIVCKSCRQHSLAHVLPDRLWFVPGDRRVSAEAPQPERMVRIKGGSSDD